MQIEDSQPIDSALELESRPRTETRALSGRKPGADKARLAVAVLFVAGVVRMLCVVLHRPLLGYANNWDFYRIAQWFGLSTVADATIPMNYAAPIARYFVGAPRVADDAYLSSELLFVTPGILMGRAYAFLTGSDTRVFDIRWIGGFRTACVVAVFAAALFVFRKRAGTPFWIAAAFAVVVADPMCTLLFNGLYCEFSSLFFAAASVLCLVHLHMEGRFTTPGVLVAGVALLGLGLSKVQNQGLPLVLLGLAATFWLASMPRSRSGLVAMGSLAVCAVLAIAVQHRKPVPGNNDSIVVANAVDTWFGALLPALPDPRAAVAELGLSPTCYESVGKDYYDAGMIPLTCPEIRNVSRLRALPLFATEPAAAAVLIARGVERSRPWMLRSCGHVEGADGQHITEAASLLGKSLSTPVEALPPIPYTLLLLGLMLTPILWIAGHIGDRAVARPHQSYFVASLLAAIVGYEFLVSLFGDGLRFLHQHFFLGAIAFVPALTAAVIAWIRFASRWSEEP
jgi:hypothetical protein